MNIVGVLPRKLLEKWRHRALLGGSAFLATSTQFSATRCSGENRTKMLICGDGDLSYGASIGEDMAEKGVELTVSVLETKEDHGRVYQNSERNIQRIESYGHTVRFGADATKLETYSDLQGPFDRIQFNFPHWRGKMNIARNRNLLGQFFASCSRVLSPGGQVCVALMDRQGGTHARSLQDWKHSWKPAQYAAEHGLLLIDVQPFKVEYNTSAYRFRDIEFISHQKGEPQLLIFASRGGGHRAPPHLQLYCHYQINVICNDEPISTTEKEWASDLERLVQGVIPSGWRAGVRCTRLVDGHKLKHPVSGKLASYQVYFFGVEKPITRAEAESFRIGAVKEALEQGRFEMVNRGVWCISAVYPSSILLEYKGNNEHSSEVSQV